MGWTGALNVPVVVVPFAAPVSVSTETPLQALTDWGPVYERLTVTLRNHDAALNAALYVDTSESGVVTETVRNIVIVPPLKEYSIDFNGVMRRYFSIAASGDPDGGYAGVSVSFQVLGKYRLTMGQQQQLRSVR